MSDPVSLRIDFFPTGRRNLGILLHSMQIWIPAKRLRAGFERTEKKPPEREKPATWNSFSQLVSEAKLSLRGKTW
jgi:hypothetical protein